jgi:hypothetical protein
VNSTPGLAAAAMNYCDSRLEYDEGVLCSAVRSSRSRDAVYLNKAAVSRFRCDDSVILVYIQDGGLSILTATDFLKISFFAESWVEPQ